MAVSRAALKVFIVIAGPAVLLSYVLGLARADEPEALWGGIDGALRAAIVPCMGLAAAGFLFAAWLLLRRWTADESASLHWPGGTADGKGTGRLLTAYALYLIPSALWLEATLLHLRFGAAWTQAVTIGVLSLVSVGLLLLGLLAWSAHRQGLPHARWLIAAVVAMAIQSTLNDNVLWVLKFPW